MEHAIKREKRINKWRRAWKLELRERHNRDGGPIMTSWRPNPALYPRFRGDDDKKEDATR
jgi:hypothetical protein